MALAAAAGRTRPFRPATEHHWRDGAVEFGNGHHDRGFHRRQARGGARPALQGLEFERLAREVGHVQPREDVLGGLGVVVGRTADKGEARQADHGVDAGPAVLEEESLDRRAAVETAGEGRKNPQATRLQSLDHPIVVSAVVGQYIGPEDQHADHAHRLTTQRRQIRHPFDDPAGRPRMVQTQFRIVLGLRRVHAAAQASPGTVSVSTHQEPDHRRDIVLGSRQPVLHGQEVGAQILGGARYELEDFRQAAKHSHLAGAGGLGLRAAQLLQHRQGPLVGTVHAQAAELRQADDLAGGQHADQGVAVLAARLQSRQHRPNLVLHEQLAGEDDVALGDVGQAPRQGFAVVRPIGGGMHRQAETGNSPREILRRALEQPVEVLVQGDDHHPDRDRRGGRRISGRSGCERHTGSRSVSG